MEFDKLKLKLPTVIILMVAAGAVYTAVTHIDPIADYISGSFVDQSVQHYAFGFVSAFALALLLVAVPQSKKIDQFYDRDYRHTSQLYEPTQYDQRYSSADQPISGGVDIVGRTVVLDGAALLRNIDGLNRSVTELSISVGDAVEAARSAATHSGRLNERITGIESAINDIRSRR